jgi:hypothetical protein
MRSRTFSATRSYASRVSLRLTPEEYFSHAARGMDQFGFHPIQQLVVCGDIYLCGDLGSLVTLPAAKVFGSVHVEQFSKLSSCGLTVSGRLKISDCPNLRNLEGGAGELSLERVGVASIGANFEAGGDMKVIDSPSLDRLNCQIGGSCVIQGCGEVLLGPAFQCKGILDLGSSSARLCRAKKTRVKSRS